MHRARGQRAPRVVGRITRERHEVVERLRVHHRVAARRSILGPADRDLTNRNLQLLPGERIRDRVDRVHAIGHVPRTAIHSQAPADAIDDGSGERESRLHTQKERHEEIAARQFATDGEAIGDLGFRFDGARDFGGADAHAEAIERGVGAAVNVAAAAAVDFDEITVAPDPGEDVEVGVAIAPPGAIVPELDRHRRERTRHDEFADFVRELATVVAAARTRGSLVEGFRYVWKRPDLRAILLMLFLIGTFGLNSSIFISTMCVTVFHAGAGQFGLLSSIMAIGSVVGALLAAMRARSNFGHLLVGAAIFGLGCSFAAIAPNYAFFGVALVVVGISALTFLNSTNSLMQLTTAPAMRNRVMALRITIALGGTSIGAPIAGWVADHFGPRWALGIGAASGFFAALVALQYLMKYRQAARPHRCGTPPLQPRHRQPLTHSAAEQ
jgi:Major Facilitator Superfamily